MYTRDEQAMDSRTLRSTRQRRLTRHNTTSLRLNEFLNILTSLVSKVSEVHINSTLESEPARRQHTIQTKERSMNQYMSET